MPTPVCGRPATLLAILAFSHAPVLTNPWPYDGMDLRQELSMRRNLIYGSLCLAALSCFAVLAVAQQRPSAPQHPAAAPAGSDCTTCPQNVPAPQSVSP